MKTALLLSCNTGSLLAAGYAAPGLLIGGAIVALLVLLWVFVTGHRMEPFDIEADHE